MATTPLEDAFEEYKQKHQYPNQSVSMAHYRDGFYGPHIGEACSKCAGMRWPNDSGTHLKSVEHIADFHGVPVSQLRRLVTQWTLEKMLANASATSAAKTPSASSSSVDSKYPLPEPVIELPDTLMGWKMLALALDDNGHRILISPTQFFQWKPGEVNVANGHGGKACMKEDCSCGFYFYWSVKNARDYSSSLPIVALAELGGVIVEHEHGCRAEYAVIRGILRHQNDDRIKFAAEIMNVPIVDEDGEPIWEP